ncbi:hypothetical protein HYS50_00615 [Candidatus Woesearchaeota archaeon]|nr:hypothetical protein [Candidatus Woesearchaeota archaeon]
MDYRDYTLLIQAFLFGLIVVGLLKLDFPSSIRYPLLVVAVLLLAFIFLVFLNKMAEPS